ncbi:MAG: hypothetical protein WBG90_04250 [Saonia sp.]
MATIITIFLSLLGVYVLLGILFAIYFFFKGAFQIDELVAESKWTVRLLFVPGSIGLWPILLSKIIYKSRLKS